VADLAVKPDFGDSGRFGTKAGNRRFWPIWSESWESTCLPENRRSPKGVPIYGKSVICRYAVVNVRCGAKLSAAEKLDAGGKPDGAVRREAGVAGAANCWCGDRWGWRCWFASVRLLEPTPCKPFLRPGPAICGHQSRRRRWRRRFRGRKFREANVLGVSRREPGAIPLMASGGTGRFGARGGGAVLAQSVELLWRRGR
jgi:hypothetical protein